MLREHKYESASDYDEKKSNRLPFHHELLPITGSGLVSRNISDILSGPKLPDEVPAKELLGCGIDTSLNKLKPSPFSEVNFHETNDFTPFSEEEMYFFANQREVDSTIGQISSGNLFGAIIKVDGMSRFLMEIKCDEKNVYCLVMSRVTSKRGYKCKGLRLSPTANAFLIAQNNKKYLSRSFLNNYGDHYIDSVGLTSYFVGIIKMAFKSKNAKTNFRLRTRFSEISGINDMQMLDSGDLKHKNETMKISFFTKICGVNLRRETGVHTMADFLLLRRKFLEMAGQGNHPYPVIYKPWTEANLCLGDTRQATEDYFIARLKEIYDDRYRRVDETTLLRAIEYIREKNVSHDQKHKLYSTLVTLVKNSHRFNTSKIFKLGHRICQELGNEGERLVRNEFPKKN